MNETGLIARAANLARLRAAASFSSKVKADAPTCADMPKRPLRIFENWRRVSLRKDMQILAIFSNANGCVVSRFCLELCDWNIMLSYLSLFLLLYSTPSANVMSHMQLHLLNTVKRCPPPPLVGPPEKNHTKRMPPTAWASIVKLSNRLTKRWPAPSVAVPDHILQPHHSNIDTEQKKPQASNITGVICNN